MKRVITILLLGTVLLAGFYFILIREENYFQKAVSIYRAIPSEVPLFFEFKSAGGLPHKNVFCKEFGSDGIFGRIFGRTSRIDSVLSNETKLLTKAGGENVLLALYPENENKIAPLFIVPSETHSRKSATEELLCVLSGLKRQDIRSKKYNGHTINYLINIHQTPVAFFSFTNKLLIASTSEIPVIRSIDQIGSKGLGEDSLFMEVKKSASEHTGFSVFIQHKSFPALLKGVLKTGSSGSKVTVGDEFLDKCIENLSQLSSFASWSGLDIKQGKEIITLNGLTKGNDSASQFISLFRNQTPAALKTDRIIPIHVSFFYSLSYSDPEAFINERQRQMKLNHFNGDSGSRLHEIESVDGRGIEKLFVSLLGNESVAGWAPGSGSDDRKYPFLVYRLKNASDAEVQFIRWLKGYAASRKINPVRLKTDFRTGKKQFSIWQFPFPQLPGLLSGWPFTLCSASFFSFFDDYLVFSDSTRGLKDFLNKASENLVVTEDPIYMKLKQNLNPEANLTAYLSPELTADFYTKLLRDTSGIKTGMNRNTSAIAWQLVNTRGLFFNQISIRIDSTAISGQPKLSTGGTGQKKFDNRVWECRLKNRISGSPVLVVNHNDKNNREIMVTDEGNLLYLVSGTGDIRWSFPVNEKILGGIHQIDFYRNGKLQYLFNTRNKIYLVDRNGKNVAGFPKIIEGPASCGLAVFDYNRNFDYRYILPLEDKRIIAFSRSGDKLKGWKPGKTKTGVIAPAQHFRISNKDIIVLKDSSAVYFLNKQGGILTNAALPAEISSNPLYFFPEGTPRLIGTDVHGTVYYVFFDGKIKTIRSGNFSRNHFFNCADLNGDGKPDFLFADEDRLVVFDETGKTLINQSFSGTFVQPPVIVELKGNKKLTGVSVSPEDKVYLLNPDGSGYSGFPLPGKWFTFGRTVMKTEEISLLSGEKDLLVKFPVR